MDHIDIGMRIKDHIGCWELLNREDDFEERFRSLCDVINLTDLLLIHICRLSRKDNSSRASLKMFGEQATGFLKDMAVLYPEKEYLKKKKSFAHNHPLPS